MLSCGGDDRDLRWSRAATRTAGTASKPHSWSHAQQRIRCSRSTPCRHSSAQQHKVAPIRSPLTADESIHLLTSLAVSFSFTPSRLSMFFKRFVKRNSYSSTRKYLFSTEDFPLTSYIRHAVLHKTTFCPALKSIFFDDLHRLTARTYYKNSVKDEGTRVPVK